MNWLIAALVSLLAVAEASIALNSLGIRSVKPKVPSSRNPGSLNGGRGPVPPHVHSSVGGGSYIPSSTSGDDGRLEIKSDQPSVKNNNPVDFGFQYPDHSSHISPDVKPDPIVDHDSLGGSKGIVSAEDGEVVKVDRNIENTAVDDGARKYKLYIPDLFAPLVTAVFALFHFVQVIFKRVLRRIPNPSQTPKGEDGMRYVKLSEREEEHRSLRISSRNYNLVDNVASVSLVPHRRALRGKPPRDVSINATEAAIEVDDDEARELENARASRMVTILGGVSCLLYAGLSFVISTITGSHAMMCQAIDNAADVIVDLTVLISLRMAGKSPDSNHPYGYGHYESLGTLFVSCFLMYAAAQLCKEAVISFIELARNPIGAEPLSMGGYAVAVAAFGILLKEALYRVNLYVGKRARSSVVIANALTYRVDALASVIALCGVVGTMMGFPFADALGGILVSALVARTGIELARDALRHLTDTQDNEEIKESVLRAGAVMTEAGAIAGVSDVRLRQLGSYCLVDLTICVDENKPVGYGYEKGNIIRALIMEKHQDVHDVNVRVCPAKAPAPMWRKPGDSAEFEGCIGVECTPDFGADDKQVIRDISANLGLTGEFATNGPMAQAW